jgi:hypothetical protein
MRTFSNVVLITIITGAATWAVLTTAMAIEPSLRPIEDAGIIVGEPIPDATIKLLCAQEL